MLILLYNHLRLLLNFCALLFLSVGCTVTPVYQNTDINYENHDIFINVIAERDGQKLRSYLIDSFRDLGYLKEKYKLNVTLEKNERTFAISSDGNAKRVLFSYIADVMFVRSKDEKIILTKKFKVSTTNNISAQGDIVLSIYRRYDEHLLKELSRRIVEKINVIANLK